MISDKPAFFAGLRDLQAVYGKALDDGRTEGFWRALEDLSLEAVRHGFEAAARTERFFPSPSVIRGHAQKHQSQQARQAAAHVQLAPGETWCPDCDDTGWVSTTQVCAMYDRPLSVVRPCGCRPGNPIYRAANAQRPSLGRLEE